MTAPQSAAVPRFDTSDVKKSKPKDYAIRFLFGGAVSLLAGLLGRRFGLPLGGLFLAFPAILPAALTLTAEHDGRKKASDDAKGACCGAIGLGAFGACVWLVPSRVPFAATLVLATAAWLAVSIVLWTVALRRA